RRRHTRSKRDWSSDVCSSDLRSQFQFNFTLLIFVAYIAVAGEVRTNPFADFVLVQQYPQSFSRFAKVIADNRKIIYIFFYESVNQRQRGTNQSKSPDQYGISGLHTR